MKVEINNLVKISTYARHKERSVQWVKKLGEDGKVTLLNLDGYCYVLLTNEEVKEVKS